MAEYIRTTTLPCSAASLREYLGAPMNLPNITDPEMDLEVMEAPETVAEGQEILFSVMAFGIRQMMRQRWVTVTDSLIVAEQVDGPTRSWRHEQEIAATTDGCSLTDRFLFEPPGGVMGKMVTEEAITASLAESTALRHQLLTELMTGELA